jgi:hypothetical protein
LIWREDQAYLAGKGFEQPATEDQVAAVRRFSEDLKGVLLPDNGEMPPRRPI